MADFAICSYSFHRTLASGRQDMFGYIEDCAKLGCTQLDPWHAHLCELDERPRVASGEVSPDEPAPITDAEQAYLDRVRAAAANAGLSFGCVAVDQALVYDADPATRRRNRARAYRWLDIAGRLGAKQVRIDAGGPPEPDAEIFSLIVAGYEDLLVRAMTHRIQLLMENHIGPSLRPEQCVRILDALPGLGLLLDSHNWQSGRQAEGWLTCAKYARATHVKSFAFTADGQELTQNIPAFIALLQSHGYAGTWGVESVPIDGDELAGADRTLQLIRRWLT